MLEEVFALGARKFIACGRAGVLDRNIAVGNIIISKSAVRDEGTSYHYMEPSREVDVDEKGINVLSAMLFHAMSNFSHGLFTVITRPRGGVPVIVLLFFVTLIVVLINKKDLFDRANNSPNWFEIR